jgi:hypothetical protein
VAVKLVGGFLMLNDHFAVPVSEITGLWLWVEPGTTGPHFLFATFRDTRVREELASFETLEHAQAGLAELLTKITEHQHGEA